MAETTVNPSLSDTPVTKKKKPRQTPQEKIAALEAKEKQLQARIKNEKAKISQQKRKDDTRRKIVVGALALEHAEQNLNSEFAAELDRLIKRHVKENDKHLFTDF